MKFVGGFGIFFWSLCWEGKEELFHSFHKTHVPRISTFLVLWVKYRNSPQLEALELCPNIGTWTVADGRRQWPFPATKLILNIIIPSCVSFYCVLFFLSCIFLGAFKCWRESSSFEWSTYLWCARAQLPKSAVLYGQLNILKFSFLFTELIKNLCRTIFMWQTIKITVILLWMKRFCWMPDQEKRRKNLWP